MEVERRREETQKGELTIFNRQKSRFQRTSRKPVAVRGSQTGAEARKRQERFIYKYKYL